MPRPCSPPPKRCNATAIDQRHRAIASCAVVSQFIRPFIGVLAPHMPKADSSETKRGRSGKRDQRRIFVLDTNVLMHDPTAIFRFDEHDIYIPMIVLEELDAGKKGLSEAARNVRQVSRFLDELMGNAGKGNIDAGIELPTSKFINGAKKQIAGRLFFQTRVMNGGSL